MSPQKATRWILTAMCLCLSCCSSIGAPNTPQAGLPDGDGTAARPAGESGAQLAVARLLLRSDPAEAEHLLLALLRQTPDDANALNDLGIARDLLGRHAEAQSAYRAALRTNAGLHAAQVNLALSLALSRDLTGAVQTMQPLEDSQQATPAERMAMQAVAALAKVPVAELPSPAVGH